MKPYLLIDFGSTYTKITAVDLDGIKVLGAAQALTTIEDGLTQGFRLALDTLENSIGEITYYKRLACSSAAGGLKMAAIGLVPELTGEAAKRAALGAGARVIKTYGFELTTDDALELAGLRPDLILLTGGTDGGNKEVIIHNSRILSESPLEAPIIIAGNKSAAPQAEEILIHAGKSCYRAPNVLPDLERLNVEPVQQVIREIFLKRIIRAKGFEEVERFIDGIIMPTPAAALEAACLLADGPGDNTGLGELMVVDIGGATTDIHSVAKGDPTNPQVFLRGLPESRVKRTVEGDLGMRYSVPGILEAFSSNEIAKMAGVSEKQVLEGVEKRAKDVDYLADTSDDRRLEEVLGFLAVKGAVERHSGRVEKVYAPNGLSFVQYGKDLSLLKTVIGTGGILVHAACPAKILSGVLFEANRPEYLKPKSPELYVDSEYLLPTLGLIAKEYPGQAFEMLKKALVRIN